MITEPNNEDALKFCTDCQRVAKAYVEYAELLDDPLRVIAKLCVAITPDAEPACVSELGYMLREHLDKHEILRGVYFGVPLTGILDDALVKSEKVKIAERATDIAGI